LQLKNARLLEVDRENIRLRGLLQLQEQQDLQGVVADVISYDPSPMAEVLTLNKGSLDGVRVDMAVVEGAGVVGQIIAAGLKTSRVLLITDRSSGVDALLQTAAREGWLRG
jgi:rod shape-determining protein MreC